MFSDTGVDEKIFEKIHVYSLLITINVIKHENQTNI